MEPVNWIKYVSEHWAWWSNGLQKRGPVMLSKKVYGYQGH